MLTWRVSGGCSRSWGRRRGNTTPPKKLHGLRSVGDQCPSRPVLFLRDGGLPPLIPSLALGLALDVERALLRRSRRQQFEGTRRLLARLEEVAAGDALLGQGKRHHAD